MTLDITAADHFCGAGGASIGLVAAGVRVTDAANHWPAACAVYSENNQNTRVHCGDLGSIHPSRFPKTTLGWFSPECFPAGTLILTERGLVPIEDIRTGVLADRVLTHQGRWRLVTSTMSRLADTVVVTGQGHPGLEMTDEHPVYARRQHTARDGGRGNVDPPEWVAAGKLEGGRRWRWATPVIAPALPVPAVAVDGPWQGRGMPLDSVEFWWLVGRWLGDGTVRLRSGQGGEVTICADDHEVEALWERLRTWSPIGEGKAGSGELRWRRRRTRTAWLLETGHQELAEWLVAHFGRLAHGKTIPSWALGLPVEHRQALVEGYISADGYDDGRTITVGTVSKSLAVGMRLVVESLGFRTSLRRYAENTKTIEGRTVTTRDRFVLRWFKNASQRSAFDDGIHSWSLVKGVHPGREIVEVFNISVEEDESYVADGIVVHNCRTYSPSAPPPGMRMPGLFDESPDSDVARSRVSMEDVIRFTAHHRYEIVMVENVVEVSRKYPIDWWFAEMEKLGYDYTVLSVNSMVCWPTPQSRDRWYACFWKVGNRKPDYEMRPRCWCAACEADVEGFQWWKKAPVGDPRKRCGKYRQQYLYKCSRCNGVALPYVWPALSALDLSLPCPRIGDRDTPLAPATIARIEAGLRKFGPGAIVQGAGNCFERPGYYRTWPLWRPLNAMTATNQFGLATDAFITSYYGQSVGSPVQDPLPTMMGQMHHGLVVNTHHAGSDPRYDASRSTPAEAWPMSTQTGELGHALVVPLDHGGNGKPGSGAKPAEWPQRTQTGRAENGLMVVPMRTHNQPRYPDEPLGAMTTAHGGGHTIIEFPVLVDGGKGQAVAVPVQGPNPSITANGSQFLVTLRQHGDASAMEHPLGTISAGGERGGLHHAVVDGMMVKMNGDMDDAGAMATPWDYAAGTITGAANQAVVPFLTPYNRTGGATSGEEPTPTLTTRDRCGVVDPGVRVEDCGFRMMEPDEAGRAMAFPGSYRVTGSKRTRVKLYGQAVTPPVSAAISLRGIESLAG